ncbi:hypothetical protein FDP41_012933 [Naegleria fowleri]|uniref:Uncharacterized protein n=1 Tax=Naegleria fowleri TaxID=5763 RepID=A0A6A5C6M5_NAEFO|nr:uncharacterized protein FDP41_012933 [Naegleria fowleri]KAF0981145.1 hypothetical protein FDP41_012933 [Naegleria fowleri]CAG4717130.1 unnamed protein product [Naegleria fowleri]
MTLYPSSLSVNDHEGRVILSFESSSTSSSSTQHDSRMISIQTQQQQQQQQSNRYDISRNNLLQTLHFHSFHSTFEEPSSLTTPPTIIPTTEMFQELTIYISHVLGDHHHHPDDSSTTTNLQHIPYLPCTLYACNIPLSHHHSTSVVIELLVTDMCGACHLVAAYHMDGITSSIQYMIGRDICMATHLAQGLSDNTMRAWIRYNYHLVQPLRVSLL